MVNKLLQLNDLTYMRSEARLAMPDTVNVQRMAQTADGQGGFTTEWSNVYQNIPARLTATGSSESLTAGRMNSQPDFMLTVASDQSIEETDRVVHLNDTYEVQSVDSEKSWKLTTRCQMRRL